MVKALIDQVKGDISNIAKTLGVAFRNGTNEDLTKYFKGVLNRATVEMMTGAFSYDLTINGKS